MHGDLFGGPVRLFATQRKEGLPHSNLGLLTQPSKSSKFPLGRSRPPPKTLKILTSHKSPPLPGPAEGYAAWPSKKYWASWGLKQPAGEQARLFASQSATLATSPPSN